MELDFVEPLHALRINPIYTKELPSELSVVIRNAVTPWNFHVIDYRNSHNLELMESSMTEWYNAYDKTGRQISSEELELGGYYAVKHISENKSTKWLRCEIVKPFKKGLPSVTAKLIDNGAFYHTHPENFYRLRKAYSIIPMQAMEATLFASDGTKSLNRQLGAEECRKFYERVEGKHFYAFVLKSTERLHPGESIPLILVDTSETRNTYIHEEFNLKLDAIP